MMIITLNQSPINSPTLDFFWHRMENFKVCYIFNYSSKLLQTFFFLFSSHWTKINFLVNLLTNIFGHEFLFSFSRVIIASRGTFLQNIFSLPSTLSQKNPFSWFIFISKLLVKFRSWTVISCHRRFQCLVKEDHLRISKSIDSRPISTHKYLKMSPKLLLQVYLWKNSWTF